MKTRCKNPIEVQTLYYRTFDKLDDFTIKHHVRLGVLSLIGYIEAEPLFF